MLCIASQGVTNSVMQQEVEPVAQTCHPVNGSLTRTTARERGYENAVAQWDTGCLGTVRYRRRAIVLSVTQRVCLSVASFNTGTQNKCAQWLLFETHLSLSETKSQRRVVVYIAAKNRLRAPAILSG